MNEHRTYNKNTPHIILAVGIVAIILIAIFSFFTLFVAPAHAPTTKQTATAGQTYHSSSYGYSFEYPGKYTTHEYTPQYVSLGTVTGVDAFDGVAEVDVSVPESVLTSANFAEFAHKQASITCDADGPSSSISCPNVSRSGPFTTRSGISGEEFYLTQATRSVASGTVAETERGPYYAFAFSSGGKTNLLLVRPSSAVAPESIDEPTVTSVANSLRLPSGS